MTAKVKFPSMQLVRARSKRPYILECADEYFVCSVKSSRFWNMLYYET